MLMMEGWLRTGGMRPFRGHDPAGAWAGACCPSPSTRAPTICSGRRRRRGWCGEPLRGSPRARHRSHPCRRRQRSLPCYGPCPSGSSEAASSPCSQGDTAHRLGCLVQCECLRRLLLDEHVEALGSLVVAAELRWRRVYARLLLPIGCSPSAGPTKTLSPIKIMRLGGRKHVFICLQVLQRLSESVQHCSIFSVGRKSEL